MQQGVPAEPCILSTLHTASLTTHPADGDKAGGAGGANTSPPRPGLASIPNDAAQKGSWFSNW